MAYYALKREAAPGVDGMTWREYETGLEGRLHDLHRRVHTGAYRATPVRRVNIDKPDGGTRPLGVAALEDKTVQKVVVDVILTPIYEEEFLGISYGFRPGRGAHDLLDALAYAIDRREVNWILDADLRNYFDTISRGLVDQIPGASDWRPAGVAADKEVAASAGKQAFLRRYVVAGRGQGHASASRLRDEPPLLERLREPVPLTTSTRNRPGPPGGCLRLPH